MLKDKLLQNLQIALKKIGVEEKEITLEHPANPDFGDYATNIALKLSGKVKKGNFLENIEWIIKNVKKKNYEEFKQPLSVAKLSANIKKAISAKNDLVYLKPKVYAKIRGFLPGHAGHPEITTNHFNLLPLFLHYPTRLFRDKKSKHVFHFVIDLKKNLDIIIDLLYWGEDFTQISSIFYTKESYLRNFTQIKKASGEGAAVPLYSSDPLSGFGAGSRISSLHQKQLFYNKIFKESQLDILTYEEKKSPMQWADEIVKNLPKDDLVEKIEVVKPGFINFWISQKYYLSNLQNFTEAEFNFQKYYEGKKIMIEYTDPNFFKEFHIGHLYSNIVGESLALIFEVAGASVKRVNYQGDVGMHVAKAIWGMLQNMKKDNFEITDIEKMQLSEKAKFMGKSYALGTKEFEENEKNKKEITELNKKIYDLDPSIKNLYEQSRVWTLDYYERIYERLGTKFDIYYFESKAGKIGLEFVQENLKKGVFEKSKGAVVFNGEKYGLHTRVFINSLGLPTYEAKDIGLAATKYKDFPYDLSIIVVANEVKEYFKVILKALGMIIPSLRKKTMNIFTGMVNVPEGKMSSRLGNIITAESLLDQLHQKAWQKIQETTKTKFEDEYAYYSTKAKVKPSKQWSTSEIIGIGAIKYALLRNTIGKDMKFSINESVNFDGNSGPYIQYTYVRTQSVLKKASLGNTPINQLIGVNISKEEFDVLRSLSSFPEVVLEAAKNFAPNLIANYLYDLAQKYNLFYQKHKILESDKKTRNFRLLLTKATGQVIKNGLHLLGIKTVERM